MVPTAEWPQMLKNNRELYDTYVEELMDGPARAREESEVDDVSHSARLPTCMIFP